MTKTFNKNMLVKLLCLIIALLTVMSSAVACAADVEDDEETTVVTETEAEEPAVPFIDWAGREFRVLTTNNDHEPNFEVIGDLGGGRLSAKVYERNVSIKEYCNVEIKDASGEEDSFGALEKDFLGGTQSYDMVFMTRDNMSSAIQRGFMKDLNDVKYIDFEEDWYSDLAIESMKISGRLYHMTSDFSLVDKARTNTLFFNRDLADELGLQDVVTMVREGTWTIDVMYQMATAAAIDDGDNVIENTDGFGFTGGGGEAALALYAGMGNTLVSLNSDNTYEIKITQDRSLSSLDWIKDMLDVFHWVGFTGSEHVVWPKDYDIPSNAFCDGRVLFYSGIMDSIEALSDKADFAYTAITYPKYDIGQEYYYTTNDNMYCSTFGIPFDAEDMDFSGYMIELLSWKSHTTTYPEYYEIKCQVQKSYDPVCAEMLRLNYEGMVFDFGLLYCNTIKYKKMIETFTSDRSNLKNVTTLFAENEKTSNNAIDTILETVAKLPE